jgi:hypothetical protein
LLSKSLKKISSNTLTEGSGDKSPKFGTSKYDLNTLSFENNTSIANADEVTYETVVENAAEEDLGETELINRIRASVHS